MKYTKYIQSHGDGIAKTLHKIRQQYGDAWTDNMASYACTKTGRRPCITWREAVPAGVKAPAKQYVSFEEVKTA